MQETPGEYFYADNGVRLKRQRPSSELVLIQLWSVTGLRCQHLPFVRFTQEVLV